jgi:hypothetical protein
MSKPQAFGDRMELVSKLAENITSQVIESIREMAQTCIHCEHFDEEKELCKLAGKRPPARVIAFGCENFQNIIPF